MNGNNPRLEEGERHVYMMNGLPAISLASILIGIKDAEKHTVAFSGLLDNEALIVMTETKPAAEVQAELEACCDLLKNLIRTFFSDLPRYKQAAKAFVAFQEDKQGAVR